MNAPQLVCADCQAMYPFDDQRWRCVCGGPLDIQHFPVFEMTRIWERPPGMWRYREALPLMPEAPIVSLGEPMTPLVPVRIDHREVLVKQEQLFPTGSFKDRGASMMVSHLKSIGITEIVEDSSGNAGSSVAAYAARAGIKCTIIVPESASSGKRAQIRASGANLLCVPGLRQAAADAALNMANSVFYASHSWNPFFIQGTKTIAFEICQQLGWRTPDTLVLPVGSGTLLLGAFIGFRELKNAGIINRLPRIIAIQAANYDPLARAFLKAGSPSPKTGGFVPLPTIAEGVAVSRPVRSEQILSAVKSSGGTFISVTEEDIHMSHQDILRRGFQIEPTAALVVAGLRQHFASSGSWDEVVVTAFTGHGLKAGPAG